MKKILTLIVMAVAFAAPSQAQFKWGVQAGLNMSNISVKEAADAPMDAVKSRAGFFIGPTVRFTLPIVGLGVDASALYDQREGKAEGETIKSQSIQIPLNVRYGIGLGSVAEVFAFAGPQFGFNIGGGKDFGASEWTLRSSNFSANIGVGATIMGKLQARINYNVALGKTGEVKVEDYTSVAGAAKTVSTLGSAKFDAWQVSVAYYF
ncbi:MAG: porin family protein [Prevotella sp.]|nr:porin family protein [Prevotella sp.]